MPRICVRRCPLPAADLAGSGRIRRSAVCLFRVTRRGASLGRAGNQAKGATAYVTLEPCAHQGKTPPCADALIEAGVARVVAATEDPDTRVKGGGMRRLRDAGIAAECGLLRDEAETLNAGYLMRARSGRPLITLKLADDPALTCRLPGLEDRSPVRIVVDARLHLPLTSNLVVTASKTPTWLVTVPGRNRDRRHAFEDCGVRIIEVGEGSDGYPAPAEMLSALGEAGLTRVLVEGGGHLAAGLMRADLVDRLQWFRAAGIIGGDGVAAAAAYGVDRLSLMRRYRRLSVRSVGEDLFESYMRHE